MWICAILRFIIIQYRNQGSLLYLFLYHLKIKEDMLILRPKIIKQLKHYNFNCVHTVWQALNGPNAIICLHFVHAKKGYI